MFVTKIHSGKFTTITGAWKGLQRSALAKVAFVLFCFYLYILFFYIGYDYYQLLSITFLSVIFIHLIYCCGINVQTNMLCHEIFLQFFYLFIVFSLSHLLASQFGKGAVTRDGDAICVNANYRWGRIHLSTLVLEYILIILYSLFMNCNYTNFLNLFLDITYEFRKWNRLMMIWSDTLWPLCKDWKGQ